jgi:hypothetical protein
MQKLVRAALKIFVVGIILTAAVSSATAGDVTLVGEVNDNFQLYADGQLYEVANSPVGDDLVTQYIGEKVEVVGTVEDIEDAKVLTVKRFRVVPE